MTSQEPHAPPQTTGQCQGRPDTPQEHTPRWRGMQALTSAVCLVGLYPAVQLPLLLVKGQAGVRLMAHSVLCLVIGVPVAVTQLYLGATARRGIVGLFSNFTPLFKGVGIAFLVRSLQGILGSQMMIGHVLFYFWGSLTSPQPWSSCQNVWNSPECEAEISYGNATFSMDTNSTMLINEAVAEREYYSSHVNGTRDDVTVFALTDVTSLVPSEMTLHKAVTLGIAWFFVLILTIPGVGAFGWLVVCICILLVAAISGLLGYGWYMKPRDPMVLLQSLYTTIPGDPMMEPVTLLMESAHVTLLSMSLLGGLYPAMGKFSGKGRIKRCWTSVLSWLLVTSFPHLLVVVLAPFTSDIEDLDVKTADDVLFILWPKIVSSLELKMSVASLFYIVFFLLGLTYSGLVVLVLSDALVEGCSRRHSDGHHGVASTIICVFGFGLSLLFTTDVGFEWRNLLSGYTSQLDFAFVFFLLFFFCIFLAKTNSFQGTFNTLSGVWFSIATFILLVTAITTTFFVNIYDDSRSRVVTQSMIGWLVAAIPLIICVIGGAFHACVSSTGCCSSRKSRKCVTLCCGEEAEPRTNAVSPEPPQGGANIVVTVGAGTSAPPYVPGFHQTAPPYYMYDQRPIKPSPNGCYALPQTPDTAAPQLPQEAWQQN